VKHFDFVILLLFGTQHYEKNWRKRL